MLLQTTVNSAVQIHLLQGTVVQYSSDVFEHACFYFCFDSAFENCSYWSTFSAKMHLLLSPRQIKKPKQIKKATCECSKVVLISQSKGAKKISTEIKTN